MRRRSLGLSLAAALLTQLAAQEPAFRLVPRPPEPPAAATSLTWFSSFAEAEAAARAKHTNLLLFFTATWCGPCKRVERETFPDPDVQQALGALTLAHIDIDAAANVEVCRRHQGNEGVPTFVLLDETGAELHRWVGALDAAGFLGELRAKGADAVRQFDGLFDEHVARAEFCLRQGDQPGLAKHLEALEQLDPARTSPELDAVLWQCCTTAKQRGDWPGLRSAARRYLDLPSPSQAEHARVLLGIAAFEIDGTTSVELQQHIDARIATLKVPFPGSTLGQRLQKMLGTGEVAPQGAAAAWVAASNNAMHELAAIGRAAAGSLRLALFDTPDVSDNAAVVLARLRLPETTPWLIERLDDPATPSWAMPFVVWSIAMHKEERCLPVLLRLLAPEHPPRVRAAAADGIKQLANRTDGTTRQDIADAMSTALESRDLNLRSEVLQALFEVHAPIPLDALIEMLSDRRALGWGDFRVCDNALWIVMKQIGMNLVGADGTAVGERCTPEIAAFVRRWHDGVAGQLRWDPEAKCYRVGTK